MQIWHISCLRPVLTTQVLKHEPWFWGSYFHFSIYSVKIIQNYVALFSLNIIGPNKYLLSAELILEQYYFHAFKGQ